MRSRGCSGFTLAEMLITLSIIGVIAAMTIPSLMNNVGEAKFNSPLKKMYAELQQATKTLQIQGNLISIGNGDYNALRADYEKVMDFVQLDTPGKLFASSYRYYKGTTQVNLFADGVWHHGTNSSAALLSNGAAIKFVNNSTCNQGSDCGQLAVDLNGKSGPNMEGYDLHRFVLRNQNGDIRVMPFKPSGSYTCQPGNAWQTSYCTSLRLASPENMP